MCAATRFCFKVSEKAAVTSGGKQYWGSLKEASGEMGMKELKRRKEHCFPVASLDVDGLGQTKPNCALHVKKDFEELSCTNINVHRRFNSGLNSILQ